MIPAAILALALSVSSAPAPAGPAQWKHWIRLSGDIKIFFLALQPVEIAGVPETEDQPWQDLAQNKVRLRLQSDSRPAVHLEAAYELLPSVEEAQVAVLPNLALAAVSSPYRFEDLRPNLIPAPHHRQGSFTLGQNLDRALVSLSSKIGSFTLGRQAVSFGAAHVVSPTDIIANYAFNNLDTEYRPGVDAARIKVPLGQMGLADLGAIFGHDFAWRRSAAFAHVTFPVKGNSFGLTAIDFKDNLLAGASLTRALAGAGFWLEGAYTWAKLFNHPLSEQDYVRASIGADYNFRWRNGLYVFLEYHYNGASAGEPHEYLTQIQEVAYQEGGVYLLGSHYLAPGLSLQVTPLLTLSASGLVNLLDRSFYILPSLEYNFSENAYLALGADLASGPEARLEGAQGVVPRSEFGLYPSLYFTSIRLYF